MNPHLVQPWLPADRIRALVELEPFVVLLGLALGSWLVYKIFLKGLSPERHRNLGKLFKNLMGYAAMLIIAFSSYWSLDVLTDGSAALSVRLGSYIGLMTIVLGAVVLIKASRIILFEWLFYKSMKAGVPVLLVNLFTLVMSVVIAAMITKSLFSIDFGPVLATSAVFSLVLGLALQDTLGNLFAGVALQLDKPYQIGDWIEVHATSEKWAGQVFEVSWRATVLTGWADELVTIPNRVIAQAQVSNYSLKTKPIFRSQIFRFPYGCDSEKIRAALTRAAKKARIIRHDIEPNVIIFETNDSWVPFKLIYTIDDYGRQYFAADAVIQSVLDELKQAGIPLAHTRIDISCETKTAA